MKKTTKHASLANENGFGPIYLHKLLATVNQHPPAHHEG
jgi:hypothetical protein